MARNTKRGALGKMVVIISVLATLIIVMAGVLVAFQTVRRRGGTERVEVVSGSQGVTAPDGSLTDFIPDSATRDWLNGGSKRLQYKGYALSDDDGELHVGWNDAVSYSFKEETFQKEGTVESAELGITVQTNITVDYPQLIDAGEHTEKVNTALRDVAMDTVDTYFLKPDDEARKLVSALGKENSSDRSDALFVDDVTWAITYNTEDFISVSYSDWCRIGSQEHGFIFLRCVNANLKTGEIYQVDDVLQVNEVIANAFVDAFVKASCEDENGDGAVTDADSVSLTLVPRKEFVAAMLGEGEMAKHMDTTFFVDEHGRPNLGVSFWFDDSAHRVWSRAWWDVTLTDELLEGARKDSSFWGLVK